MGDFNQILDVEKDRKGGAKNPKETGSANLINAFLEECDWLDVWRTFNPGKFEFTWKRNRPLIMRRIDYVFAPIGTFGLIEKCKILPAAFSDHCPIICNIRKQESIRGPGLWKCNSRHLSDKELVDQINEVIDFAEYRYEHCNLLTKWEMIKLDIRQVIIQYSRYKAASRKKRLTEKRNKLDSLNKKLSMINLKSDTAVRHIMKIDGKIDQIRAEIQKEELYDAQGVMMRAKARWMEQGEHSTKYFFSLEKARSQAKVMNRVRNDKGEIICKAEEIMKIQAQFYQKLYTSNEGIKCDIRIVPERKISDKTKQDLDSDITIEEIQATIKQIARNKSPGTDGFQIDLYIVFWLKLKSPLFDAFNYGLKHGILHETARTGVITLIPKKERDMLFVRNWRPIVLLNTDYKILSKTIAA